MAAIRGSCLCGGVKFEITGPLLRPLNCHCTWCRKQQGAAFRSRARVLRSDFKWVQGEDLLTYYEATPGYRRGFSRYAAHRSSTGPSRIRLSCGATRRSSPNTASRSRR